MSDYDKWFYGEVNALKRAKRAREAREAGEAFVRGALEYEHSKGYNYPKMGWMKKNGRPDNSVRDEGHAMTPDSKWAPLGGQQKGDG